MAYKETAAAGGRAPALEVCRIFVVPLELLEGMSSAAKTVHVV
jgi:hypothetical protein